ncbi:MAG: 30S ribosomal protein S6 [Chloroflexi bacterium]|nr:30S ribosomal protein S6 [Chloroflexota bacterium]
MREYEVTIIVQPQLDDAGRDALIERVTGWLTHSEDEADQPVINHWGMRQMAYPINDQKQGYYVLYEAKMDPAQVKDTERNMHFVEDLLRYLIVRKEG